MDKVSFLQYTMWDPMIEALSDEMAGRLYKAVFAFATRGEEPAECDAIYPMFALIKSQMDKDQQKYEEKCKVNSENGAKGGRPKKRTETEETERFLDKPNATERVAKKAYSDSDSDNDSDSDSESDVLLDSVSSNDEPKSYAENGTAEKAREIISYLNDHAGTRYRANAVQTKKHINARLEDGYTVEDFKRVIDVKCAEWLGTDMAKYLSPDTLFSGKFEKYLNQSAIQKPRSPTYMESIANRVNIVDTWV